MIALHCYISEASTNEREDLFKLRQYWPKKNGYALGTSKFQLEIRKKFQIIKSRDDLEQPCNKAVEAKKM